MTDEEIRKYLQQSSAVRKFMNEKDLTQTQLEAILYLGANGFTGHHKGQSVGKISSDLNINGTTLSLGLSHLWLNRDLVYKQLDKDNQRTRRIKLTTEGEKLYNEARLILINPSYK